jgi:signal transduction histidine kinase
MVYIKSYVWTKFRIWLRATIILFSLFIPAECFSQNAEIDSLTHLLKTATSKELVDVNNRLSFDIYMYDVEKSNKYSHDALNLAEEIKYQKGIAESSIYQGLYHYLKGDEKTGRRLLIKGEKVASSAGENGLKGYALIQLGNLNRNLGKHDSAYYYYQKSYQVLKDSLHPWYLGSLYGNLAKYYNVTSRPRQEIKYLQKALRVRQNLDDKIPLIDILLLLSGWNQQAYDLKKAGEYLEQAEVLISKETPEEISINLKTRKARLLSQLGDYEEALKLFNEVNEFYARNTTPLQVVRSLTDTGLTFEQIGDFEASQKIYYEALHIAEANNYPLEFVKLYIRIAWVHFELGHIKEANEFIEKAISESVRYEYLAEQGDVYNLQGVINKYYGTLKVSQNSLQKSLAIRTKLADKKGIAETLKNLGDVMERKNDPRAALSLHTRSLQIDEEISNKSGIAWSYYFLGRVNMKLGDFERSKSFLDKAEQEAKTLRHPVLLKMVFTSKRELLEAQGMLKEALTYSKLFEKMQDSVFNQSLNNRVNNLQFTYKLDQKEKELQLLAKNQELQGKEMTIQKNIVRQQYLVIVATLLVLVLVGFLAWTMFRKNRKIELLNHEIQERTEEIQTQAEELVAANNALVKINDDLEEKQNAISSQNHELIHANEEIRARRDQLDRQNIELESIRRVVQNQNDEIKAQNENLELEVVKRTQELVQYSSQLEQFAFMSSHNLRAPVARILGLGELLSLQDKSEEDEGLIKMNLIKSAKDLDSVVRDLNTILDIRENRSIPINEINIDEIVEEVRSILDHEIIESNSIITTDFNGVLTLRSCRPYLSSIILNLISNAIRYRHPQRQPVIKIKGRIDQDYYCLEVSDNGLGINLTLYKEKIFSLYKRFHDHVDGKGLGLYLIKTQVLALGGRIDVESEVDVGTKFSVWLKNEG